MNFVFFIRDQHGGKGAEAETYLANGLVAAGHQVYVILASETDGADKDAVLARFDHRILGTHLPVKALPPSPWPRMNLLYRVFADDDAPCLMRFVQVTKYVLPKYHEPILVTAASSVTSLAVGYYCRKKAHRWMVCSCDEACVEPAGTWIDRLKSWSMRSWMRKARLTATRIVEYMDANSFVERVRAIA